MEFRILGPLEATVEGTPLPLGGRRQQRILAVLLLRAGRVVTPDKLVDCLWPLRPPATASSQIRNCAAALRRQLIAGGLPEDSLIHRPGGYRLTVAPGALDRTRFDEEARRARLALADGHTPRAVEAFLRAEDLWRGPAIAGLADGTLEPEAMSLEESRLQVIEDRLEAELSLGWHARAVPELTVLARTHPGRDRLQAALMVALYGSGRVGDALASFDRLRTSLRAELGLEPSRRLRDLRQAILTEDEARLQPVGAWRPARDGGSHPLASPLRPEGR
ncbi:AfsR/SARP family transcriptional regulator [Micromonospora sp. NIE79]|uniref:AfsR/SARP family transcriptional regulator n=1 Tax=Micromonospora trifolii TaxID=2911208 RepID=A0ABS9N1F2_9ACTN|nr:AfsR/SARP family transcriptional regulator [Micromonospora trifolii]MCG5443114.1 AfsR/SARP family transcriptional regulator [Micromonospora trifolii]